MSGLASRLYRGEANLNVVGRRRLWFSIAGTIILVAVLSFAVRGFSLGIDFKGGSEFQVPASVGTMQQVSDAVSAAGADVVTAQSLGGGDASYLIRTAPLSTQESAAVKSDLAQQFKLPEGQISDSRVSAAWGGQVTRQALVGLAVFLVLVVLYLVVRFEWRMAVAALGALLLDLFITSGVYSLVGFEVTPSTIIGFLTILGFALYDVVVVFDKIQENTRGITGGSNQTYAEAANLAVNQTLMRSINTSVVALLPVGGLLFIGAGLLGAGTLKDLGLVLFVGMGSAFFSSIFFATPLLVALKEREPKYRAQAQRVFARRASLANKAAAASTATEPAAARPGGEPAEPAPAFAGSGASAPPRPGARPSGKRSGKSGKSRSTRPSGAKRR